MLDLSPILLGASGTESKTTKIEAVLPGLLAHQVVARLASRDKPVYVRITGPLFYDPVTSPVSSTARREQAYSPERRSIREIAFQKLASFRVPLNKPAAAGPSVPVKKTYEHMFGGSRWVGLSCSPQGLPPITQIRKQFGRIKSLHYLNLRSLYVGDRYEATGSARLFLLRLSRKLADFDQ